MQLSLVLDSSGLRPLSLGCTDLDEAGRKDFIARTQGGMKPREQHPE
jgi:hypothetical protein